MAHADCSGCLRHCSNYFLYRITLLASQTTYQGSRAAAYCAAKARHPRTADQ